MDTEDMYRVSTRITHTPNKDNPKIKEPFIFHDICLIYKDQDNKGYCVAISQSTSKVGLGHSREEAYINLIISLLCAIWRGRKKEKRPCLGIESKKQIWETLDYVHRMPIEAQNKLLKKVTRMFSRCMFDDAEAKEKELLAIKSTYDEQYDTVLKGLELELEDTMMGTPFITEENGVIDDID